MLCCTVNKLSYLEHPVEHRNYNKVNYYLTKHQLFNVSRSRRQLACPKQFFFSIYINIIEYKVSCNSTKNIRSYRANIRVFIFTWTTNTIIWVVTFTSIYITVITRTTNTIIWVVTFTSIYIAVITRTTNTIIWVVTFTSIYITVITRTTNTIIWVVTFTSIYIAVITWNRRSLLHTMVFVALFIHIPSMQTVVITGGIGYTGPYTFLSTS